MRDKERGHAFFHRALPRDRETRVFFSFSILVPYVGKHIDEKVEKALTHALSFSPRFSHQPNRTTDNNDKSRKINIPMRAYVPSGIPMLKSVGTRAFPLAGTLASVALHVTFKKKS